MSQSKKSNPRRRAQPKPVRPGTKRATLVKLMSRKRGATLEQLAKATKWDEKTAMDGVRLVRVFCRYPVRRVEDRFFVQA